MNTTITRACIVKTNTGTLLPYTCQSTQSQVQEKVEQIFALSWEKMEQHGFSIIEVELREIK
jgi:hypothetical protein